MSFTPLRKIGTSPFSVLNITRSACCSTTKPFNSLPFFMTIVSAESIGQRKREGKRHPPIHTQRFAKKRFFIVAISPKKLSSTFMRPRHRRCKRKKQLKLDNLSYAIYSSLSERVPLRNLLFV